MTLTRFSLGKPQQNEFYHDMTITKTTFRKKQDSRNSYSADDIFARTHLIVMRAQNAGNFVFDGHEPTEEEVEIQMDAKKLANHIERLLDTCKDEDILLLADLFDNVYRIGYNKVPDSSYMNRLYRRAFEAWKSGNRNIEESSVFAMIATKMANPRITVDDDMVRAYYIILDRWAEIVGKFGRFPNVTSYENYIRLSMMRTHRIKDYYQDPTEARRRWYEKNKVEDLTELSSVLLRSYRRFVSSMWPDVISYKEHLDIDNQILLELYGREDVDPRDREAYRLALQFNETELADV